MSGIEIAGLVLGTFPILIQTLEKYRSGAETVATWWMFENAYRRCLLDLKLHHVLFEGTIERLLPFVVDDSEREYLIMSPQAERWTEPELETRLKEHLPRSYEVVLGLIAEICQCIEELKDNLCLNNSATKVIIDRHYQLVKGKTPRSYFFSLENINFQSSRLGIALRRSSQQSLFARLQLANANLRNLMQSTEDAMFARKQRDKTEGSIMIETEALNYSKHATRLYEAVSKAWMTPPCGCASHVANLQLQDDARVNSSRFNVLFNMASNNLQCSWKNTLIVHSQVLPLIAPAQNSPRNASVGVSTSARAVQGQDNPIVNLCSSLSAPCSTSIGFLEHDQHRFVFYPHDQTSFPGSVAGVTLSRVLENTTTGRFTRAKRYSVAYTISKWLLQLGSTPWLEFPFKDTLTFFRHPAESDRLNLETPYIRRDLSQTNNLLLVDILQNFGICLIELCFGKTLESTDFHKKMLDAFGTTGRSLDCAAAGLWSNTVGEEAGPEFQGAVKWCLHAYDVDENDWRKDIRKFVIEPLRLCHESLIS